MDKIFVKLLRNIGAHKSGAIVEIDEPIARAYIEAGAAEEHKAAAQALAEGVSAEDAELSANLRTMVTNEVRTALAGVTRGLAEAQRPDVQISVTEAEDDKKVRTGGFRSAGHFAHTLVRGMNPSGPDAAAATQLREWHALVSRAATGMNESVDAEGGLLVPSAFSQTLWDRTKDYENLADRIDLVPVAGNSMTFNATSENSRANGSRNGGVQAYWIAEAQQYIASKPTFRQAELKLKKLTVLVYATNELLEDTAGAVEAYINRVAPAEIAFKMSDALVSGGGAGIPMGYLASGALVTVPKEAAQAAQTIVAENISKMWARVYAPSRRTGVWVMNQDIETQLDGLKYATGSSSGQLVYMPPTGLAGAPYSTIKGRPVVVCEGASTLGTVGDLAFVDFSQFIGIKKASGIKSDVSMHLRFDYDETVFKFSLRVDMQPMWDAPLTPYKGTNTLSPFVALATRA